tara:strand:- start:827 stop:1438 length:612 start_codon:yes stop_codon:yes gene_type:complete
MEAIVREAASEYVYGVKNPARVANKYKLSTLKKILLEEYDATLKEDGHEDTSSAVRKLKTSIEDASEILQGLQSHHGDLPSWWMSKVTIAADYLNKARDYFLVSGDVMQEEELDERCQKGYKTHPTRKTKQMFGRTYRNCVKAEGMDEEEDIEERKLKPSEKKKLKSLEKKVPKKDFTDRYGEEGKSIYYATLTKMAKKDKKK